jgi:hypothetical protein
MNQRRALRWASIAGAAALVLLAIAAVIGTIIGRVPVETAGATPTAPAPFVAVTPTLDRPATTSTAVPEAPTSAAPPSEPQLTSPTPGVVERTRVIGTGTDGLSLRAEPGSASERLKILADGAELELTGDEQEADGRIWRAIRDPSDGMTGWVAAEFLETADSG